MQRKSPEPQVHVLMVVRPAQPPENSRLDPSLALVSCQFAASPARAAPDSVEAGMPQRAVYKDSCLQQLPQCRYSDPALASTTRCGAAVSRRESAPRAPTSGACG